MHVRSICRRLAGVLVALLLGGLLPPVHAESLTSRLRHLRGHRGEVRGQVLQARQQVRSASAQLDAAEQDLNATQARLGAAQAQLAATRRHLDQTRAKLVRLQGQLDTQTAAVQAQMLALYRAGDSSYLNVVMNADSFSDFANRGRFVSAIVNQDKYVLDRLDTLQNQYQAQRAVLAQQVQTRAALVSSVAADEQRARARRVEIKQILRDAESKRAACEAMLAAMDQEMASLQAIVQGSGARYAGKWSGYFRVPVEGYRLTSPFGWRMHPILHVMKLHQGVDLACAYDTPLHAADKGLVIFAGWHGPVSGNTVVLSHGSGLTTCYCHQSAICVSVGQMVTRGQQIGNVGSTGRSTGPHCHFGVMRDGQWVDPMSFTR